MLLASSKVLPSERVFFVISEPARSTKLILPAFVMKTPSSACTGRDKDLLLSQAKHFLKFNGKIYHAMQEILSI